METYKKLVIEHPEREPITVALRSRVESDMDRLVELYGNVTQSELAHFDENVKDSSVIEQWFEPHQNLKSIAIVADAGDKLIGECAITWRPASRSAHVGDIRFFLLPEYRHLGIGLTMLKEIYFLALRSDIEKLTASIPRRSVPQFKSLMEKLGFSEEATLKRHIKNPHGAVDDLVIYGLNLENLWDRIADWQSRFGRAMED